MQVKCDKCTTDLGYGYESKSHEYKLVGGFYAILCLECRNRWHEHLCGDHNDRRDRQIALISDESALRLAYEGAGPGLESELALKIKPIIVLKEALNDEYYLVGKEWVEDKIPEPSTAIL